MSTLRTFAAEPLYGPSHRLGRRKRDGEDVVKLDCYAVLGLSPTAEDVVIRAAYLALMRAYHPDRNGSAEAAARARAITEAYKTIGDPARRAEYDAQRSAHLYEMLGYDEEPEPLPRRRRILPAIKWPEMPAIQWPKLAAIQWPKPPQIQWPQLPAIQWPKAPAMGAVAASALAIVLAVTVLPLTPSGQADTARTRATEATNEKTVADHSPSKEEESPSERVAEISSTPVDTSPPEAAAPTIPEKTEGNEPAETIAARPVAVKADALPRPERAVVASSPPPAARPAAAKAAAVDEKARIASLEGMSTSFYNQSVIHADEGRRAQLQQARDLFVTARNACKSDSCVGDAHANYMRDISRIMKKPN